MYSANFATSNPPTSNPFYDFWLPDYCPRCNPAGQHADSCLRAATEVEPDAVTWLGGRVLTCEYVCGCGHTWTRDDLWTAECFGLKQRPRRNPAA